MSDWVFFHLPRPPGCRHLLFAWFRFHRHQIPQDKNKKIKPRYQIKIKLEIKMNRYQMVRQLGDGSFGTVWLANTNSGNSDRVAVKKMKRKFFSWDECVQLREVKSLKRLQHRNIIRLREVIREHDELYFIFDFMEGNLYQVSFESNWILPESEKKYSFSWRWPGRKSVDEGFKMVKSQCWGRNIDLNWWMLVSL